jgi:hypothetical protein
VAVPHCVALLQSTHAPAPLQKSPVPHAVFSASGGLLGAPAVHTSAVHALPSTGTSLSKARDTVAPAPSHSRRWQLPAVCPGSGVPFAV